MPRAKPPARNLVLINPSENPTTGEPLPPAPPIPPDSPDSPSSNHSLTSNEILKIATFEIPRSGEKFAVLNDTLYRYDSGAYHPTGTDWCASWLTKYLRYRGFTGLWSPQLLNRITSFFKADCLETARIKIDLPSNEINLLNGILRLEFPDHFLFPSSPAWLSPVQLPIHYDPSASPEPWNRFLAQILNPDCLDFIWEVIGSYLTPNHSQQHAIWLSGIGANGKSTFIQALRSLLGDRNVSTVSLTSLAGSTFSTSDLQGKLLNIDSDADVLALKSVAAFKQITGGDTIRAERKYQAAFDYNPFCSMLFSGNEAPRTKDTSEGLLRRILFVDFPNRFKDSGTPPSEIIAPLLTPSARSGALNCALLGLAELRRRGRFDPPLSVRKSSHAYRMQHDPVFEFIKGVVQNPINKRPGCTKECRAKGGWFISSADLYRRYRGWAKGEERGGNSTNPKSPHSERSFQNWIREWARDCFRPVRISDHYIKNYPRFYHELLSLQSSPFLLTSFQDSSILGADVELSAQNPPARQGGWDIWPSYLPSELDRDLEFAAEVEAELEPEPESDDDCS